MPVTIRFVTLFSPNYIYAHFARHSAYQKHLITSQSRERYHLKKIRERYRKKRKYMRLNQSRLGSSVTINTPPDDGPFIKLENDPFSTTSSDDRRLDSGEKMR